MRIAHLPNPQGSYYSGRLSISRRKKDSYFVEKLNDDVAIKEPVNDFHMLPSKKFVHVLKSLDMNIPPIKISEFGIQSLAIHPSETSLIIAAGDRKGNITLYNRNSEMQMSMVHKAQVNCISFCTWNPNKLFSTSHDGSVGYGDTVKHTFDIIYKSERKCISRSNINHTTWHSDCERNLFIGNGSGHVDMIDTRLPDKIINSAWCHQRSVCTVQCHPLLRHYFLTSSETGEVSLWDIRNMTDKHINPVLRFKHPKELTSSFFSADGTKMVSTCIDNNIRIFNTEQFNLDATKPTCIIPYFRQYYEHSLQAKWNSGRNDAFFITSMLWPARMQVYDCEGNVLHDLISKNMKSRCIVMEVHPTQAIYVGGNTYGRLHIFSTKNQLI
ncbi:WD repeat-containing protein 76-like isoform X2 [Acyrthosiphon pisum]|nr:WD repeat-containing protein 76-like isoform X2 [Acyrthosiphon pisum]